MLKLAGIYTITTPSGKFYVGSASNFSERFRVHRHRLRSGKHHCLPLQNAFHKYDLDGLKFEILLVCDKKDLLMYEQRAIDTLNPQYNACRVAGNRAGHTPSIETRKKTSASLKGKMLGVPQSEEHRVNNSEARRGIVFSDTHLANLKATRQNQKRPPTSDEQKAKISAANKGRTRTAEVRARISAGNKGKVISPEVRAKISAAKKAQFFMRKLAAQAIEMPHPAPPPHQPAQLTLPFLP